jgi:two-component system, NarL family, nitrate/nitrite response regulator NarL
VKNSIALVVTHPCTLFREGLRQILMGTQFRPVHTAPEFDEIAEKNLASAQKCLRLMGLERFSAESFDSLRRVRATKPELTIVVLAECHTAEDVLPALEAGANGFLDDDISRERLIKALELIVLGETVVPAQFLHTVRQRLSGELVKPAPQSLVALTWTASCAVAADMPTEAERLIDDGTRIIDDGTRIAPRLSSRELAILRLFMEGASNKVIARQLAIAEATVKVHNKAILRKLRLQNRTQAAVWAHSHLRESRNGAAAPIADVMSQVCYSKSS